MPANAQYWRPTQTPECSITSTRKAAWRSVKPSAATALTRSAYVIRGTPRRCGDPDSGRSGPRGLHACVDSIAAEARPALRSGIGAAVVGRDDLDVLHLPLSVRPLVLDSHVGKVNVA